MWVYHILFAHSSGDIFILKFGTHTDNAAKNAHRQYFVCKTVLIFRGYIPEGEIVVLYSKYNIVTVKSFNSFPK